MSNNLISIWHAAYNVGKSTMVIPDGCRDLIVKTIGNNKPQWVVSPLMDQSELIQIADSCVYTGFRLCPGAEVKEKELLAYIDSKQPGVDEVKGILDDFIVTKSSVEEALGCLAAEPGSVKQVAIQLGVTVRTLQRLIFNETNRTPGYWLQLARIRKAARSLSSDLSLIDVADDCGFSDQSHMNREFQRWFRLTPMQLQNAPGVISQLNAQGYG